MTKLTLMLRRLLLERVWTKLLSLGVALALFFFVREGQQETKSLALPLELSVPRGVVQTNEVARQVEISITGPKAAVDSLNVDDLGPLTIDLSPFGTGVSTYFFQKAMIPGLGKGVSVSSITPSYVVVRIEKEIQRKLPITLIFKGHPAHGYRIDSSILSTNEATLVGPTSLVDRTDFLETAPLDIRGASQSITHEVPIRLPAPSTRLASTNTIAVTVHIIEAIVERRLEGIPVVVTGAGSERWIPDPLNVSAVVKGPERLVEKLNAPEMSALVELPPNVPKKSELQIRVQKIIGLSPEVAQIGALPEITLRFSRPPGKTEARLPKNKKDKAP